MLTGTEKPEVKYSGTSDKGPSEIGMTSLEYLLPKGTTSLYKGQIVGPKVSLVRRFHCSTVVVCV